MINEKDFLNSAPAPKPPTKEDLQIKKLKLQIEALEQKKQQQAQKEQEQPKASKLQTASGIVKALGAIALIILSPFVILGGFLLACAKAAK